MSGGVLQKKTVALAGNPNVGKSTVFNALTGLRQHTGNWPGKTVGVATGSCRRGNREYTLIDLPGTYSLEGSSEDEVIAAEFIAQGRADCTVVVCDGSCLERTLILALQILSVTSPVVVCVNLMDEAASRGIQVDGVLLAALLEVPVVLTAAGKGQGLETLLGEIEKVCGAEQLHSIYDDPIAAAQEIAEKCVIRTAVNENWRQLLDRILVSHRYGVPILLALIFLILWLTVWGANYPSQLLSGLFDRGYGVLAACTAAWPGWLSGLLVDGIYGVCTRVISVMLPPMAIFFPLFTILEDVGYLPRMAFLFDHSMRKCGGCGKQALTMCMGLGCNAVGVMGCRIIDSPRERLAAILTNAFLPCNGRFPTLILLGSLFFSREGGALAVAACVALGAAGAMGVSMVLSKTALQSAQSTFLMELPPFRRPRLGQILVRSLLDRTLYVSGRAICVAAPAGAVLWLLANTGLLEAVSAFLDPAGRLLGMNGVLLLAFVCSLPANELLIPVMLMALSGAGSLRETAGLGNELLLAAMDWKMAVCAMVFSVFHWPCSTTLMTIYHETGSIKKTAAAFVLPTAVGIVLCILLKLLLGFLP